MLTPLFSYIIVYIVAAHHSEVYDGQSNEFLESVFNFLHSSTINDQMYGEV